MRQNQRIIRRDARVLSPVCNVCRQPFRSRRQVEIENLFLRHQLNIAGASVNETIKPVTDLDHRGVAEHWSYPDGGYGDCEDYALA